MHQDLGYPEHQVHRERVCELLWPDREARAGRNNLHGALHAARRALAAAGESTQPHARAAVVRARRRS